MAVLESQLTLHRPCGKDNEGGATGAGAAGARPASPASPASPAKRAQAASAFSVREVRRTRQGEGVMKVARGWSMGEMAKRRPGLGALAGTAALALAATAADALDVPATQAGTDAVLAREYPSLDALYKDIHAHPELGFQEVAHRRQAGGADARARLRR